MLELCAPEHVLCDDDWEQCHKCRPSTHVQEANLEAGKSSIQLFRMVRMYINKVMWRMLVLENVAAVIYVLDLDLYDRHHFEDIESNRLHESLVYLEQMFKSKWFQGTNALIVFSGVPAMSKRLSTSPFPRRHFPDYKGADSQEDVVAYIERLCKDKFSLDRKLLTRVCDVSDIGAVKDMLDSIPGDLLGDLVAESPPLEISSPGRVSSWASSWLSKQ